MKTIIALRGKGGTGKSTTIRDYYVKELKKNHYSVFKSFRKGKKDITQIFKNKSGRFIGLTSLGDNKHEVTKALKQLIPYKCEIYICAARTSGGTNEAIEKVVGYNKLYIPKVNAGIIKKNQDQANRNDAKYLWEVTKRMMA